MDGPYIEIDTPDGPQRLELAGEPLTVGRHPDNRLPIDDDRASRFHCVIEPGDDGFRVRDLKSRNGTKLNETPIKSSTLRSGDVVRIGKTRLRFVDPTAAPIEVAPGVEEPDEVRRSPQYARPGGVSVSPGKSRRSAGGGLLADDDVDYNALLRGLSAPADAGRPEDYASTLREMTRASNDPPGEAEDVELVSAKGQIIHPADVARNDSSTSRDGVNLLRLLLFVCMRTRATDLHVEPKADQFHVRIRVDGTMVDAVRLDQRLAAKLIGVVKVLSDIDIAQRLVVQEGHFSSRIGEHGLPARSSSHTSTSHALEAHAPAARRVDYRVSFTPSMYGQKLVLRVLDLHSAPQYIDDLLLPPWMKERIRKVSRQDSGMLLACGPTGSGKTTTLYAVLREIDSQQRNVITIEDPVEYHIDGVTQIPIDPHQGNTFSTLLRSVLRQDPDVILLGEIRDRETSAIAMQAAMTGHLLLSTVHAKDSIGAVFRLLDLGVEPYLVASSLNLILAQRLVRQLCPHCKAQRKPTPQQTLKMGRFVEGISAVYYPVGCPRCLNTGYFGRRALFELLAVTDDLRDVILKNATIADIRETLKLTMFTTLQHMGYQLAVEGVTSVDEVERVAGE